MQFRQASARQRQLDAVRQARVQRTGGGPVYRRPAGKGGGGPLFLVFLLVLLAAGALYAAGRGTASRVASAAGTPTPGAARAVAVTRSASSSARAAPADGAAVAVVVKPGDTWTDVADQLASLGLIHNAFLFRVKVRLTGSNGDLEAGSYTLHQGMTEEQIIQVLEHATVPEQVQVRFTEGWRMEQDAQTLADKGVSNVNDFLSVTKSQSGGGFSDDFLADRPAGATLEGYLFPDTYDVLKNATAHDVVVKMLDRFGQQVTPQMRDQARAQGHSLYQVLIVASIVEREAAVPQERPLIAGVYWNRLKRGDCMCADPTVQYALGQPGTWWPTLDAEARTLAPDSPFNTYTHLGFPPGPICSPGLASIDAALHPQGDYLYFVAKGDGTHIFSHTLDEQTRNQQQVQSSTARR